jgi:hypothetical protein
MKIRFSLHETATAVECWGHSNDDARSLCYMALRAHITADDCFNN